MIILVENGEHERLSNLVCSSWSFM